MKTLSCREMKNSNLVRKWSDEQLSVGRAAEVRRHLRACPSCFNSLMRTTAHSLFTYLNDGDTAQRSCFREQVSHILRHGAGAEESQ